MRTSLRVRLVPIAGLLALLTACGGSSADRETSSVSVLVRPCAPDKNGICYAQEKSIPDDEDWKKLQATLGGRGVLQSSSGETSVVQVSRLSSSSRSAAFRVRTISAPVIRVTGGSIPAGSVESSNEGGTRPSVLVRVSGRTVFAHSLSSSSRSAFVRSERTSAIGLRSERGGYRYSNSRCARNRSFLSLFPDEGVTTGRDGFTFPVLLNGDCPVSAAMLKVQDSGRFGGLDFGD